jgi:hypothetical protein
MSTAFTFSGTLSRPSAAGQPNCNIPLPIVALSAAFNTKSEDEYILTGSGTKAVDMASVSIVGAKFFSIEVGTVNAAGQPAAAPVMLRVNGGSDDIELAPGGWIIYSNPSPTAVGILSLSLIHTFDAKVTVRVYG